MFSLKEALEKCNKEELIKGKIIYEDIIPYSMEEIEECSEECENLMKVLEGSVEKANIGVIDTDAAKLLKKYIFNDENVEEIQISDDDVDNLIELRLMVFSESPYLEMLDKLIFRIYFEKEKYELFGLIQSIYDKYNWTKTMISKYSNLEKSLIFQDMDKPNGYNKKFGINHISNKNNETMRKDPSSQEQLDNNWILQKFGG